MNSDGLYHISLMGGQARAILVESTQLVQRAKDIHGLSRIATAALGRTLTAAVMMGSMLKGEDESVMQARIALCMATRQVVANALRLIKVSAPEVM